MNCVSLTAIYGGAPCGAEEARQVEIDEPVVPVCPGCGLTREEDEHSPTPCFFENCPMKDAK